MKIRVPVEVAMVLARWRTFEMLMEDNTSEVVFGAPGDSQLSS